MCVCKCVSALKACWKVIKTAGRGVQEGGLSEPDGGGQRLSILGPWQPVKKHETCTSLSPAPADVCLCVCVCVSLCVYVCVLNSPEEMIEAKQLRRAMQARN